MSDCHQQKPAHAVVLHASRIDRRNGGSIAVAEEEAAAKGDGRKHAREHFARFRVHEIHRARQGV